MESLDAYPANDDKWISLWNFVVDDSIAQPDENIDLSSGYFNGTEISIEDIKKYTKKSQDVLKISRKIVDNCYFNKRKLIIEPTLK